MDLLEQIHGCMMVYDDRDVDISDEKRRKERQEEAKRTRRCEDATPTCDNRIARRSLLASKTIA